jgi:plasmid maintenance system antidote protein VapI
MINFNELIKNHIEKTLKISWNQAARMAGVDNPRIYAIRDGKSVESKTLEKILNAFGAELVFTTKKK